MWCQVTDGFLWVSPWGYGDWSHCWWSGKSRRLWGAPALVENWIGWARMDLSGCISTPQRLGGYFCSQPMLPFWVWQNMAIDLGSTNPPNGWHGWCFVNCQDGMVLIFLYFLAEPEPLWMASWVVGLDPMHLIMFFWNHGFEVRGSHHVCLFPQMIGNDST